ncbi:MAG: hypothetical protein V3V16_08845 [Melioribacteraceae bacterium]
MKIKTKKSSFANASTPARVSLQLFFGSLAGRIFGLVGGLLETALTTHSNCGHPCLRGILGGYIGYIVGTSVWTYIADGGKDRNLSYPLTFLSGVGGAFLSFALTKSSNSFWTSIFLAPLISDILYTNLGGTNNTIKQIHTTSNIKLNKNNLTHHDYYNSTKLFEMNLFRINF